MRRVDAAGAERFPAAGRFPGAGEALLRGGRSGWRGAGGGVPAPGVAACGAGVRLSAGRREGRVRLKGSAMPGGQGLPGVGWVFPGSDGGAIFRRRGGCDGFCEVCGASGRGFFAKNPG